MPTRLIFNGIPANEYNLMVTTYGPAIAADRGVRIANGVVEVDYTYNDFMEKHRGLLSNLRRVTGKGSRDPVLTAFSTPFYTNERATSLQDGRESYRGLNYKPEKTPGFDPANDTQAEGVQKSLAGSDGMCLGGGHGDPATTEMFCDLLDNGTATNQKIGFLCIEEIKTWAQSMLDDYLDPAAGAALPPELDTYLTGLDRAYNAAGFNGDTPPPKGFRAMVEKAKAKGVKVYGIDSGAADPGCDNASALHPEPRVLLMNKLAENVIRNAQLANPNKKFIASVGAAHMNTHEGGIPGLAQIFNIPAVSLDANKKLTSVSDNVANRAMPSQEEQIFIDKMIAKLEAAQGGPEVGNKDLFDHDYKTTTRAYVKATAAKLKAANRLDDAAAITTALDAPDVVAEIKTRADTVKARVEFRQHFEGALFEKDDGTKALAMLPKMPELTGEMAGRAVMKGRYDVVQTMMSRGADPTLGGLSWQNLLEATGQFTPRDPCPESARINVLATLASKPGTNIKEFGDKMLVDAVDAGNFKAVKALAAAGADPTRFPNSQETWQKIIYRTALLRRDKQQAEQADAIEALAAKPGVDLNALNGTGKDGKSIVHLAAWNGNTAALAKLDALGADMHKLDGRNWTPSQIAMGSDKPAAEKYFYSNGHETTSSLLPANQAPLNTVDMLLNATMIEVPEHRDKMKEMYESLYSNEALRPVMDLIALDSTRPRDPDTGGGLRIFAADSSNVTHLFHPEKPGGGGMLRGAYADQGHIMQVVCSEMADTSGTLIHELTHAATRLVYGDKTIPARDGSPEMDNYKKAIRADVENLHAMDLEDQREREIADNIANRMEDYAARAASQGITADDKLMQEFIVGVPQLLADYGEPTVKRFAPNLLKYYKEDFNGKLRERIANDTRFAQAYGRLDNAQLDQDLAQRKKPVFPADRRVKAGRGFSLDKMKEKLTAEFKVRNGRVDPAVANGATVAFSASNFVLNPAQTAQLQTAIKTLEVAWPAMVKGGLPPSYSFEDIRGLIQSLGAAASKSPKEMKGAVAKSLDGFARNAKQSYVQHQINHNLNVTDAELAEAIVLRAENSVFEAYPQDDANEAEMEVSSKKHAELIKDLTRRLGELPADKKQSPGTLLARLGDAVAGGSALGFYKKQKEIKKGGGHVSIDVKAAKRVWLSKLAQLKQAA